MKPTLIALMGMWLCGCEMYPEQNADQGKLFFPPAPKKVSPPAVEPIKSPTASGTKAEAGDPQAQYDLAVSYQLGEGIVRDDVAAYKWYTIAAANSSARGKLKARVAFNKTTLAWRMTREQIAEAEKSAKEFLDVSGAESEPAVQSEAG